jgi:hypothetical protein
MRTVIRNRLKKIGKKTGLSVLFLLSVVFLPGCNASRESICRDFPSVAEEIGGIQIQIAALESRPDPKRGAKPGRRIASVSTLSPQELLDRREALMQWGEKALKRTQWAKDTLEDDKRGRKAVPALNEAGLYLVSFHGFLDQEKWKKADAELDRVEASLTRARKIACDVEAPAAKPARKPAGKSRK